MAARNVNVKELSNDELRQCLKDYGMTDVGPVQSSTRELYEKQLKKRMRQDGGNHPDIPITKKRKLSEANSPSISSSRVIKRSKGQQYRSPRQSHGGIRGNRTNQPRPIPRTPKLAADSYVVIDDDKLPSNGFKPSLSSPEVNEHVRRRHNEYLGSNNMRSGLGMSLSDTGINPSIDDDYYGSNEQDSGMETDAVTPLHRKPIHGGKSKWLGESLSSTARMIGEGVKSFVSSFLTPPAPPTTTQPSPFSKRHYSGAALRNQDSIEIGGELEIKGVSEEIDLSPEPSAPPFPIDQQIATHYDWELLPEDVQFCVQPDGSKWCLGKGGFGEVFKGLKDGVDEVAVKVIRLHQNQSSSMDQFKQEIDLISKLRHRNILQFYGACIRPHCLYMVTELMQSDLFTALKTNRQYRWAGEYGREVCVGIATGIHYLHSRRPPIVHRDIKSPNVLLMDGLAKIADVGIAKAKMDSDMTAQRGFTVAWAAPEVIYRRRATEKIDIWSFGVILWEVVTGRPPGVGRLSMPITAPTQLRTIYNNCTKEDPQQRPATDEILVTLKTIT